jgi:hypothetical protein
MVRFTACSSQAAGKGKEAGFIVEFPFDVLGGDAATVAEHFLGDFASNHEVCYACALTGPKLGRVVEPSHCRRVVSWCQDAVLDPTFAVLEFQQDVDRHPKELKKVIDKVAAVDYAFPWDSNSPGKAGDEAVPADAKWAQIRPADTGRPPGNNQVDGDALVRLG